jgi:hypothetical protein
MAARSGAKPSYGNCWGHHLARLQRGADGRGERLARRSVFRDPTKEHSMSKRPFLDLAALIAPIFVLGMSGTAVVVGLLLLTLALLL